MSRLDLSFQGLNVKIEMYYPGLALKTNDPKQSILSPKCPYQITLPLANGFGVLITSM